nr:hypothetical protein [Kibdelosporangium sp. MJ126-NF4]
MARVDVIVTLRIVLTRTWYHRWNRFQFSPAQRLETIPTDCGVDRVT